MKRATCCAIFGKLLITGRTMNTTLLAVPASSKSSFRYRSLDIRGCCSCHLSPRKITYQGWIVMIYFCMLCGKYVHMQLAVGTLQSRSCPWEGKHICNDCVLSKGVLGFSAVAAPSNRKWTSGQENQPTVGGQSCRSAVLRPATSGVSIMALCSRSCRCVSVHENSLLQFWIGDLPEFA